MSSANARFLNVHELLIVRAALSVAVLGTVCVWPELSSGVTRVDFSTADETLRAPPPEYVPNVCREARELQPVPLSAQPGETVYQAMYAPSFDPHVCITASTAGDVAEVTVDWVVVRNGMTLAPVMNRLSHVRSVSTRVTRTSVASYFEAIERAQPSVLWIRDDAGLDGMRVTGVVAYGRTQTNRFAAWSPKDGSDHQRYFLALLKLALDVTHDTEAIKHLEDLVRYISNELSVRDIGGTPRVIRLFGQFSAGRKHALSEFVGRIPPHVPLVLDASNFGGAWPDVYPTFVSIDSRPGGVAWVATDYRARSLVEMGIKREHIVSTVEEARKRLAPK